MEVQEKRTQMPWCRHSARERRQPAMKWKYTLYHSNQGLCWREYCHGKGAGKCIQKDDLEKIMPAYKEADIIVFASPIYYFTMTAQMQAAIQRMYCIWKPLKAQKCALLLSSGSPDVYDGAIAQFKAMMGFSKIDIAGIITAHGEENKSEAKMNEIREFAKSL